MRIAFEFSRGGAPAAEERVGNPLENPTIPISASAEDFLAFFGQISGGNQLPLVTIESALEVPAIWCAVNFLSRLLASLPLHVYRKGKDGAATRSDGELQMLLNEAPNSEWTSQAWREYMWTQVFTGGRATAWIERQGSRIFGIWPMDPDHTTVERRNGRKIYTFEGRTIAATDVIDIPFLLKRNQIASYSPIFKHKRSIGLMLAMSEYGGSFFSAGGVLPLALEGPLPQGADALKRAQADIQRAIDLARKSGRNYFPLPPGHSLKPIATDPDKGQMVDALKFQLGEASRIYQMPPVFLHDLTHGTFSNTEQQDLQLVKHVVTHWAGKFEQELCLKLFGQRRRSLYVEHNVDGVQRGSFKERVEGIARMIQTAQITPNEARALENRGPMDNGDKLLVQGATVPLGEQPLLKSPKDNGDDTDAGTKP